MVLLYDVLIVGGGPAGLAAALCLLRSHRSVCVLDSSTYRNASASHMQNVLTHDGRAPSDFLALGHADLRRYPSLSLLQGSATRVQQLSPQDASGHPAHLLQLQVETRASADTSVMEVVRTRRLLLACGVTDVLPSIPGLAQAWGDTAHLCPYCHGWEHRGTPWALLLPGGDAQPVPEGAQGMMGAAFASMFLPVLASFHPRSCGC